MKQMFFSLHSLLCHLYNHPNFSHSDSLLIFQTHKEWDSEVDRELDKEDFSQVPDHEKETLKNKALKVIGLAVIQSRLHTNSPELLDLIKYLRILSWLEDIHQIKVDFNIFGLRSLEFNYYNLEELLKAAEHGYEYHW